MEGSAFSSSIKGIKLLRSEDGELLTKPFLDVCKNLLPILDKFGSALSVVKSDVGTNVSRLERKYKSNPTEFKHLFSLVRAEVEAKTAKAPSSCTNSLLWLTRIQDFFYTIQAPALINGISPSYCCFPFDSLQRVAQSSSQNDHMFFEIRFEAPTVDFVASKMVNSEQLPSLTVKNKMSNGKMKGLLKGLRYISQIFESEKEPEMEIGFPTDVKHVAHIGWEGPSVNSPSWMNEFSSKPVLSSPTLSPGDSDSGRLGLRNIQTREINSPAKEQSEKSKSRRSSKAKGSSNSNKMRRKPMDPNQGSDSPTLKHSSSPKKSRRKTSKDSSSAGGSTRSRSRAQKLETG